MPDWEELREAGNKLKQRVMRHLDTYLLQLEESVQKRAVLYIGSGMRRRPTGL